MPEIQTCPSCGQQTLLVVRQIGGEPVERCRNPVCGYSRGKPLEGKGLEAFGKLTPRDNPGDEQELGPEGHA